MKRIGLILNKQNKEAKAKELKPAFKYLRNAVFIATLSNAKRNSKRLRTDNSVSKRP